MAPRLRRRAGHRTVIRHQSRCCPTASPPTPPEFLLFIRLTPELVLGRETRHHDKGREGHGEPLRRREPYPNRGLPANRLRRCLLREIAAAPLLRGMPAEAGAGGGDGGDEGEPARPFPLSNVRLLDAPYRKSQPLNARYLESLNCDRLLHKFRRSAGLPPNLHWVDRGVHLRQTATFPERGASRLTLRPERPARL